MAPKEKYSSSPIDFLKIAEKHEGFSKHVKVNKKGTANIDWKNPKAILELTKAILKIDYEIDFDMPLKNLCPPIPQRLSYIKWVKDLLDLNKTDRKEIKGIDIGTGSSCIFPLLGNSKYNWNFIATEVDSDSIKSANRNVQKNGLNSKIQIRKNLDPEKIFDSVIGKDEIFDFCICNPPFFSNIEDSQQNKKRRTMAIKSELVYPNGEIGFIGKMIEEGKSLQQNFNWFTTMLGKKSSIKPLIKMLRNAKVTMIKKTVFSQGKQTRWGLAWTFKTFKIEQKEITSKTGKFLKITNFEHFQKKLFDCLKKHCETFAKSPDGLFVKAKIKNGGFCDIQFVKSEENIYYVKIHPIKNENREIFNEKVKDLLKAISEINS